jgi:hypothetical protein
MYAKSKALAFVLLLALALVMLLVMAGDGHATITKDEQFACDLARHRCVTDCSTSAKECKQVDTCYSDCKGKCDLRKETCLDEADKTAPKAPHTNVQPKVKPGGAETPGTESPNVQPKGGIQR